MPVSKRVRVAVYGRTAVLAGVEARLRRHPAIEVLSAWQETSEVQPDVILFDTAAHEASEVVSFLQTCSGARLIGLDVDGVSAITLSRREDPVITVDDLAQLIIGRAGRRDANELL